MELESHSDQGLDQDNEERQEKDSELRLELDYPTEPPQQDQTGTLHSIKTLVQFKKSSARFITSQTWPAVRISTSSSQSGEFEHVLERIRMSSAKLQHETYGVHTLKVVFINFLLLAELFDSSPSAGSKTLKLTAFASLLVTSLSLNIEKRIFVLRRRALKKCRCTETIVLSFVKNPPPTFHTLAQASVSS